MIGNKLVTPEIQDLKEKRREALTAASPGEERQRIRHEYAVLLYEAYKKSHNTLLEERRLLRAQGKAVPFSHHLADIAFRWVPRAYDIPHVHALEEDEKAAAYERQLSDLREQGVALASAMSQAIAATKQNKMLSEEARSQRIAEYKERLHQARRTASLNKDSVYWLSRDAVGYVNRLSSMYEKQVDTEQKAFFASARSSYYQNIKAIKKKNAEKKKELQAAAGQNASSADKQALQDALSISAYETRSALYDAKNAYLDARSTSRANRYQSFLDRLHMTRILRNGKTTLREQITQRFKNYVLNFTLSQFLLTNGLYLAIIAFFIACIILASVSGNGNLFSLPNILTILEQSSTRMFYALGVAGLILLTGTDLSIGRMVAMGSVITGLILHPGRNIVTFFRMGPWDFSFMPMGGRVILAVVLSVTLCVMFSMFAGVFTARLKIHPFISTLSTQLIIYGLLFFGTSGTPVGSIDSSIKDMLGGRWILGFFQGDLITFPKLIIPAVIAVIITWFIWNKTTFGKEMYAVGGNSEAASVSGISVFRVTMGVFIMAGILYGFGAFFEAFKANASAGTGQGYELDAIAACVVGGISFNGGIGKIGGAVIGVIIFTSLTYCLTFLGIDTNLQFVFKGLIIISAVALDSVKYLKRK